jgi:hypothetical protein
MAGGTRAVVIALDGGHVVTIGVAPPGSLPAVERALDTSSGVRG